MGEEIDVESRTIAMHLETRGSRKALGAINAKLRAKVGRLERDLSAALTTAECADNYAKMFEECAEERDHQAQRIGKAVEVVAYIDDGGALYTSKLLEIMSVESDGCEPLMTVAQHQRILAAATHPADQVAEITKLRELLAAWRRMFDGGICSGPLGTLCGQTDAALAKPNA